jgi:Bacterial Ig-like domain
MDPAIPIEGTVTCEDRTISFSVASPMDNGITYTASLTAGVAKDRSGNPSENDFSWSFTTISGTNDSSNTAGDSGSGRFIDTMLGRCAGG